MRLATILSFNMIFTFTFSQSSTIWGMKAHTGFIIPHSSELKTISGSHPFGLQFEWSKLKTSDKAWATCNCYGRTGFSFAYFDYNNQNELGSSSNVNFFSEPYLSYKKPLKLSLRSSVGVSYLTRLFDQETNPDNLFFSSIISFYLQLGLNLNYNLSNSSNLNLSFNYNHISNGGLSQPNKGMNFPTLSIGYDYIVNRVELVSKPTSLKQYNSEFWSYMVIFGSMRSSNESTEASNHLRSGISYGLSKPTSRISNLTGGVEIGYDGSYKEIIEERGYPESPLVSAMLIGHQFSFGNIYFLTQFGFYVTRPKTVQPKSVFQNYSLWYRFNNHFGIATALIAYGHIADHMDFRLIWFIGEKKS